MAVDTPARIAILGAGPIGLEAALYARFLGYDVDIYETGKVAENVLRWGHVRMFSPFGMNRSPLGLAALAAHDEQYQPPQDDEILTGREWAERYLLPLAGTDLLSGHIHENTTVVSVGREGIFKGDLIEHEDRGDYNFRLLIRDATGNEQIKQADVVIDATGTYGNPNWAGQGGIPALGETQARSQIEYHLPDVLDIDRAKYAGKHTLLIGAGHSAATTITALAKLAAEAPGTSVTWITRRFLYPDSPGPVRVIENDPLPARRRLADEANLLAKQPSDSIVHFSDTVLHSLQHDPTTDKWRVELLGEHAGTFEFGRIIANVGYQPNQQIFGELQVRQCIATGGPTNLAAKLLEDVAVNGQNPKSYGPESLMTTEPNFYILGAKSFGRHPNFLVKIGLEQIRDLFTVIGDRPTLDLYAKSIVLPKE